MNSHFLELASTPAVAAAQTRFQGRTQPIEPTPGPDVLGEAEREFIESRDTFYLSTVSESGWPYVQHRGGPAGFLRVVGENVIAFADYRGNRQMLTTGNVSADDRVAMILMDYPRRARLKLLGHATVVAVEDNPELAKLVAIPGAPAAERLVTIEVVAFDWNCPKYITPRYTEAEIAAAVAPLRQRISELENELRLATAQRGRSSK
jgi:predicted pyridoxine 5'-phosphate oxidase superfamily flavin-nucleotide-binding protein